MKRALVTGASGFTGRYLAPVLAERGMEVHGIVQSLDEPPVDGVSARYALDVADRSELARVLAEVRPDHVVHLAAIAFVGHDDVDEMYRTNIVGTRQLLDLLSTADDKPRSILLASSANVYGNARGGILTEDIPPDPANDYGITKVALEQLARRYRSLLPITIVRPFNYTGHGQSRSFLIPKIVSHAVERDEFVELGNTDVERDFSDVRMVVDAYARLLESDDARGQTFNICSGKAVSLHSIVETVSALSGHRLEIRINPDLVRASEVHSLVGSAERVESVIGPLAAVPLRDTLQWMLRS